MDCSSAIASPFCTLSSLPPLSPSSLPLPPFLFLFGGIPVVRGAVPLLTDFDHWRASSVGNPRIRLVSLVYDSESLIEPTLA